MPNDAGIAIHTGTLQSQHMKGPVSWAYSVPTIKPIAALYCLHGLSNNCMSPFDDLQLHDMVASQSLPLVVAGVNGGRDYWHQRANGEDPMAMLINEFIPLVEQKTGVAKRSLYGWSMGGYGVLLAGETHPDMFDAVVALSPALWTSAGQTAPGAFDNAEDFAAHNVFTRRNALVPAKLRVACGTGDPFYKATKQFVAPIAPPAQASFSPGIHDFHYWRSVSPAALNFVAMKSGLGPL